MPYTLEQLNRTGPPPLLAGIETPRQWEEKRAAIWQAWTEQVGAASDPRPAPRYRILSEHAEADHTRLHIQYDTVSGAPVPAYLLVPSGVPSRRPAVLALHPTSAPGKADIATDQGRANRQYGLELVRRGYVVLAPDVISAGERVYPGCEPYRTAPFYQEYPNWSAVGKMAADHMQGVDILASLDSVDPGRIGAIGHSLGGYNAFYLAGFDRRVRAVVSSCGLSTFAGDPDPGRWGKRDWFTHLPGVTDCLARGEVPFEWHEVAALAAPTPFLNWSGQSDHIFPHWQPIAAASLDLHRLYERLGAGERYVGLMGTGGHDFPPPIRSMAYDFLDRWLV